MPRCAPAVLCLLAAPALAGPPVSVELKTGDVVNERVVLSLDLSQTLGEQRSYALGNNGDVVAGAVSMGDFDDAPVTGFALISGDDGSIIPRSIYEQTLLPGESLVSFTPRNLGPDGAHHSVGYTLTDGESFARSSVFVGQIGQPTRRFTADDLWIDFSGDPGVLRLDIPRVSGATPSEGYLVQPAAPYNERAPLAAGDNTNTLVLTGISESDPIDVYDPAYQPGLGLLFADDDSSFSANIMRLSPPFVGQDAEPFLEIDMFVPALFGGMFEISAGPSGLLVSQNGHIATSVVINDTNKDNQIGLLVGDFTRGFEIFARIPQDHGDDHPVYDTDDARAISPNAAITLVERVIGDTTIHERALLFQPAFPVRVLYETNAPVPGLPDDLRITRTHWHKVSDTGAVLMALRLAPVGDPDAGFDAVVSRTPLGLFDIVAREGQPIPGDAEALGVVTAIDTSVIGAPSEQVLTADGKGLFAATFDSASEAILSVQLGDGPCSPADLAQPYSVFNATDALAFLTFFGQGSPAADLDADMDLDFDDVLVFVSAYANACP